MAEHRPPATHPPKPENRLAALALTAWLVAGVGCHTNRSAELADTANSDASRAPADAAGLRDSSILDAARPAADAGTPIDSSTVDGASVPDDGGSGLQSFEVDVDFSWAPFSDDVGAKSFPSRQHFTLTVDSPSGRAGKLVIGGRGITAVVATYADSSGEISFADSDPKLLDQRRTTLQVGLPPSPANRCMRVDSTFYSLMDLRPSGDGISGTAQGFATYSDGDAVGARAFSATVVGTRDRKGPALASAVTREIAADPFDGVAIDFDEALPNDPRATLRDSSGAFALHPAPDEYPSRFTTYPTLLPFGRQLLFQVDGALGDLAGNTGSPPDLTVVTPNLAGPFTGFEGAVAANLAGRARIVDDKVVPVLSGRRGLLMDSGAFSQALGVFPGGRFTARLAVPDGASTLVITARGLAPQQGGYPWLIVRSAAVGGIIDSWNVGQSFIDANSSVPSGVPDFPLLGAATTTRHPLPASVGGEVVVDLSSQVGGCNGLGPPLGASLIESILVE